MDKGGKGVFISLAASQTENIVASGCVLAWACLWKPHPVRAL